jgi:hypothetical protein
MRGEQHIAFKDENGDWMVLNLAKVNNPKEFSRSKKYVKALGPVGRKLIREYIDEYRQAGLPESLLNVGPGRQRNISRVHRYQDIPKIPVYSHVTPTGKETNVNFGSSEFVKDLKEASRGSGFNSFVQVVAESLDSAGYKKQADLFEQHVQEFGVGATVYRGNRPVTVGGQAYCVALIENEPLTAEKVSATPRRARSTARVAKAGTVMGDKGRPIQIGNKRFLELLEEGYNFGGELSSADRDFYLGEIERKRSRARSVNNRVRSPSRRLTGGTRRISSPRRRTPSPRVPSPVRSSGRRSSARRDVEEDF